jgi:hypothetical protein
MADPPAQGMAGVDFDVTGGQGETSSHAAAPPYGTFSGSTLHEGLMTDQMRQMKAQLDGLTKQMKAKAPASVDELVQTTELPFTADVMAVPLPLKFKIPQIDAFDGTKDPLDHLETYKSLMHLQAVPDAIMCRAFPIALRGAARMWFNKFAPNTISTFKELSRHFVSYFIAGQRYRRPATYLLNIKQAKGETLREFTTRFNKESMQVDNADDQVAIAAYMSGLRPGQFLFSLSAEPPTNMAELMMRAQRQMNAEDTLTAHRNREREIPSA